MTVNESSQSSHHLISSTWRAKIPSWTEKILFSGVTSSLFSSGRKPAILILNFFISPFDLNGCFWPTSLERYTRPENQHSPWEKAFPKGNSSSKHPFSGPELSVRKSTIWTCTYHLSPIRNGDFPASHVTWGNDPIWLIFFKWVWNSTTN